RDAFLRLNVVQTSLTNLFRSLYEQLEVITGDGEHQQQRGMCVDERVEFQISPRRPPLYPPEGLVYAPRRQQDALDKVQELRDDALVLGFGSGFGSGLRRLILCQFPWQTRIAKQEPVRDPLHREQIALEEAGQLLESSQRVFEYLLLYLFEFTADDER